MAISEQHRVFVAEYIKDFNATRAAIAAGYSKATARQQGCRLLTNADIQAEVAKRVERRLQKLEISAENVLNELAFMGFANMQDYITVQNGDAYVDLSKLTREQAAAIQEITVEEYSEGRGEDKRDIKRTKFKLNDKRGSLELLGRHLKLFTDKLEHSGGITNEPSERLAELLAAASQRAKQAPQAE